MVLIMDCAASPMALRTSLTQRVSDSSITITSGQMALINSSLITMRPALSRVSPVSSSLAARPVN
jgi:hypothetical protein